MKSAGLLRRWPFLWGWRRPSRPLKATSRPHHHRQTPFEDMPHPEEGHRAWATLVHSAEARQGRVGGKTSLSDSLGWLWYNFILIRIKKRENISRWCFVHVLLLSELWYLKLNYSWKVYILYWCLSGVTQLNFTRYHNSDIYIYIWRSLGLIDVVMVCVCTCSLRQWPLLNWFK